MTTNIRVDQIKVGDVIMPPAREVSLWMRRMLAERGLPESALYLTVTETREGNPDKNGRWLVISSNQTAEWINGGQALAFRFKARPETAWPKVA